MMTLRIPAVLAHLHAENVFNFVLPVRSQQNCYMSSGVVS